ncbi:hypothetical protein CYMTET_54462, partial [Cymbomonas tetramitiformis]
MVKGEKSKSPNLSPSYSEAEPELKPGENFSFEADEFESHKQQITALTRMVESLAGNMAILQQAHLSAAVPVDMSDMSLPGGRQKLPTLSEMTKGLRTEQHFSRQDAQNERVWREWRAKIAPSLRHPSLALLLSEGLVKLRRNTSLPYFITQLETLISQAGQSGTLAPPLQMFLDGKETLQRIREYASVAGVMPSGKSVCLETLECVFTARVLVHLHPDYLFIKTKFVDSSLPTLDYLSDQVSSHYDTILAPRAAATQHANAAIDQSAGAIADDRRKQEELKRKQLAKKVPCPQCHRPGHVAKDCFMTNVEKREEFCKRASPAAKAAVLKKVAEYEKHGKLPAPGGSLGAVAGQSDVYPGLEHSGEALFALATSAADPDITDTGESSRVLRVGGRPELHPGLAEMGSDVFGSVLTHVAVRSDSEHSCADVAPFELSYGRGSHRPALLDTTSPTVVTFNYYSVLDGVGEPAVPVPAGDGSSFTTCGSRSEAASVGEPAVPAPAGDGSSSTTCGSRSGAASVRQPPRRPRRKVHCYVPSTPSYSTAPYSAGSTRESVRVFPVYDRWVYIDTIAAFFPTRARLEKTQSVWEAGRVRHLGRGYRISPRQLWFTPSVQRVHANMVSNSGALLLRAKSMLHRGIGFRTDSRSAGGGALRVEMITYALRRIRGAVTRLEELMRLEPVVVRVSFMDLKDWASELGLATGVLMSAVDSYGLLLVDLGAVQLSSRHDSDSGSDSDYGDDLAGSDYGDGGSMPDLESVSDSDSDSDSGSEGGRVDDLAESASDSGSASGSVPDLCLSSDSEDDDGDLSGGRLPRDAWACGMFTAPGLRCFGVACGASAGSIGPSCAVGKCAILDSGATRHIFNSMDVFGEDFDPEARESFRVVQTRAVSSTGSGSVTFANTDLQSGRLIGLRLLDAHCIPGQSFNLISVVALEDAGFSVDFGARQISSGGAVFSFSRIGNQSIIHEDCTGTPDTYMACAAHTDRDQQRDRSDWKFEDTEPHFTIHGPFHLELFASDDNHILSDYCTLIDSCFDKDWAGRSCYGNPPFEHEIILRCLQKALEDFARDPAHTKFLFVLPKWTASSWWHLTTQFSIVHEYPAGHKIFSAPTASCYNVVNLEPCGEDRVWIEDTRWPVVVFFKDSHTVEQLDLKMLQH